MWVARVGPQTSPAHLLEDQLTFAAARDYADRVALLFAARRRSGRGLPATRRSAAAGARARGRDRIGRIPDLLLAAGAAPLALDPVETLLAACMRGDGEAVRAVATPGVVEEAIRRHPTGVREAAAHRRPEGVRLLHGLGFNVDHLQRNTALHEAAWNGDRPMVELLLALGANPTLRDTEFGGTPAGWARHNGHPEIAALLPD